MAKVIASLRAWYIPGPPGGQGSFVVDGGYLLEAEQMHSELEARARGQPLAVKVEISPVTSKRSLAQNRLMWELLHKLALAMNGGGPGTVTAEHCYLDMLQAFGGEVELLEAPIKALPTLRGAYRVVDVVELLDGNRCVVRCGLGSSSFTTQQMHDFIERIFDRLAELGVNDAEAVGRWREWSEQDG